MSYADALESYLVPVEEAEKDPDHVSTPVAIAVTMVAFAAMGLPDYFRNKKKKKAEKLQKEATDRLRREEKEKAYAEWERDPKTKAAKAYVNKKYQIDLDNPNEASKNKFQMKIYNSIKSDIIKISKRLNKDKKTLLALAKQAAVEDYLEPEDIHYIKNGICREDPEDYGDIDYPRLNIDACDQAVRDFALYAGYFDAFTNALNEKYKNEIQAKIISDFTIDDWGCICFSFE